MIKFLTFSKKNCSRLEYRAVECGWFHKIEAINECQDDLPTVILKSFEDMSDGDILVYANEFSDINLDGEDIFMNQRIFYLTTSYDIIMSECEAFQKSLLYIKKSTFSENLFKHFDEFDKRKNIGEVLKIKPNLKFLQMQSGTFDIDIRHSENDIVPNCRMHYYEPYAMFVAGHVLPLYEVNYDAYTHFINVGSDNLHRVSANDGDNIKDYQDLAELTALYWIWKNLDISDLKYIGFSTYRKPFFATNEDMFKLLEEGNIDCIANEYHTNFRNIHMIELGEDNVTEFEDIVKSILPSNEYEEFLNDYRNSKVIYICNSFVIKSEMLDELCKKVFDIMLTVSERMRGKCGVKDHRPCAGCFAECVMSFYLKKLFKNIYTKPFLIYPLYKQYSNGLIVKDPMIFGTYIQPDGSKLFFPLGEHPKKDADQNDLTTCFYSEADRKQNRVKIFTKVPCYKV